MSARRANIVNRFGWVKYFNKPRTEAEMERCVQASALHRLHLTSSRSVMQRHRYVVPNVASLALSYTRRGAGQAG